MKFTSGLVLALVAAANLNAAVMGFTDDEFPTGDLFGKFGTGSDPVNRQTPSAFEGVEGPSTAQNPCWEEFQVKDGKTTTTVQSCVEISRIAPFGVETAPGAGKYTKWCFNGDANDNGQIIYNKDNTIKHNDWKFCQEEVKYVTTGGFVPEGTQCAFEWNYNNGGSLKAGVQNSCVKFSDFPPYTDSTIDVAGSQDKYWCYTGFDQGINPTKTDQLDKIMLWGFCAEGGSQPTPTGAPTTTTIVDTEAPTASETTEETTAPTSSGTDEPSGTGAPTTSTTTTTDAPSSDAPTASPTARVYSLRFATGSFNSEVHDTDLFKAYMKQNIADELQVPESVVDILSVRAGSVVVDFSLNEGGHTVTQSNMDNIMNAARNNDGEGQFTLGAAPTGTPTPAPGSNDDGLSGGAIAGIVIACLVVVGLLIAGGYMHARKKRQSLPQHASKEDQQSRNPEGFSQGQMSKV